MSAPGSSPDVDAVVVGGGFSGLYATMRLVGIGLTVRAFDAGPRAGGVWNWNSYPGARTDSWGETYQFSSDREFAMGWEYSTSHPEQAEVLAYLQRFAEHYDLLGHYTFDTTVVSAHHDDDTRLWTITTDAGETVRTTWFVPAMGLVSAPNLPDLPGLESFSGEVVHTSRWPEGGVELAGRRVAVIGTGSSGVQLVPAIADDVAALAVFQRTPNWVAPSATRPLSDADHARLRDGFTDTWRRVRRHPAGLPWEWPERSALDVSDAERDAAFDQAWNDGGFALMFRTFSDVGSELPANELACEWMRSKIASIVDDPAVAATLTPSHPYGTKRPPSSTGWYETFNKSHVELVDVRETPITGADPHGVATTAGVHPADVIVLATGFDAITGAYTRVDIRGSGGRELRDVWASGPDTYLGLAVAGFPNMLMVAGPHTPAGNLPPGAQEQATWIAGLISDVRRRGVAAVEPTEQAQKEWKRTLDASGEASLVRFGKDANSWFTGSNIEGKAFSYTLFFGGADVHADLCDAEAADGYPGFRDLGFTGSAPGARDAVAAPSPGAYDGVRGSKEDTGS